MRRALVSYLARRGAQDLFAAVVLVAGMWTVMTWAQVGADFLRLRLGQ
jgi:glucose dehydrogenase